MERVNSEVNRQRKKDILNLFVNNFLQHNSNEHLLGMVLCGSFKNDDNNDFSDIDIQIIMDETFSRKTNVNRNGGNILRGVEIIDDYRFEYFVRNIQGYYYEAMEAFKQQKNALLTIIGYGDIFYYKDEGSLKKIQELQEFILDLYSKPLPSLEIEEVKSQLITIYAELNLLIDTYNANPDTEDFEINYFLLLEKVRKFYSRSTGCCYLPPAKVWKIYHDKDYAERFCKSKIPDNEFITKFFKGVLSDDSDRSQRIKELKDLIDWCKERLGINFPSNVIYRQEENTEIAVLDDDEIFELIVILENRRIKLNEKYVNKGEDFTYFYYIVLAMIERFCLKINNSLSVIDERYKELFLGAKVSRSSEERCRAINLLLDYIKEKCEKVFAKEINPLHYKVLVKPTTWDNNSQARF